MFVFVYSVGLFFGTLALHALVDDTIEKATTVVTECGAVVGVLLEMVLRPRVLRYVIILPIIELMVQQIINGGTKNKVIRFVSFYFFVCSVASVNVNQWLESPRFDCISV